MKILTVKILQLFRLSKHFYNIAFLFQAYVINSISLILIGSSYSEIVNCLKIAYGFHRRLLPTLHCCSTIFEGPFLYLLKYNASFSTWYTHIIRRLKINDGIWGIVLCHVWCILKVRWKYTCQVLKFDDLYFLFF